MPNIIYKTNILFCLTRKQFFYCDTRHAIMFTTLNVIMFRSLLHITHRFIILYYVGKKHKHIKVILMYYITCNDVLSCVHTQ